MCRTTAIAAGKLETLAAKGRASEGEPRKAYKNFPIRISPVNPAPSYDILGEVNSQSIKFIVDTGAAVTLLRGDLWDKATTAGTDLEPWTGPPLVGVEGTELHVRGCAQMPVSIAGRSFTPEVVVVDDLSAEAILGRDFLERNQCTLDLAKRKIHFGEIEAQVDLAPVPQEAVKEQVCARVMLGETRVIPPLSELEVMADVEDGNITKGTWILESSNPRPTLMVARSIVKPEEGKVPVRLLNPRGEPATVYQGTTLAVLEQVEEPISVSTIQEDKSEADPSSELKSTLWKLVSESDVPLTPTEQEQLFTLLVEYSDIFANNDSDYGHTNKVCHNIPTGDSPPIRQQLRRIPLYRRDEVKKLLQDMRARQVIRPSNSPWASPIVLVRKRDGSTRFCVDYRKVNTVTRKDAYPLPRVDDTLDTLAGSKWFSTLDLISGYWQVEVDQKDREKTAFTTPEGLFEFNVMPFGLCNAPATFQRLMDLVLAGLQWSSCLVYLDDVIVTGKTFSEHLLRLKEVFDRLREAKLKLKPSKCAFCKSKVTFLGHIVSTEGVITDPGKVDKVKHWPQPTSRKEVQQFLGLANYYRRFVKDFATIARPLHKLTEKTAKFQWTEQCQAAFEKLRNLLTTAPVLAFPDYDRPFILDTDASDTGLGAVLSQVDCEGKEHVIAYASRTLSKAERAYCVTRKELLAVVTFVHQFRPYLIGRKFTLRTDHGSLTWLSNFKHPEGQMARWLEKLQEYNFEIIHRRGRQHQNADSLSRLPCKQCGRDNHLSDEAEIAIQMIISQQSTTAIRQSQRDDPSLKFLLQAAESEKRPSPSDIAGRSKEDKKLLQMWKQLEIREGVLWRRYETKDGSRSHLQLVVPKSKRQDVLKEIHAGVAGGHLGEEKTLSRLKERYYWPGHWTDVREFCRTCSECTSRKSPSPRNRGPLTPVKSGYPMQIVAVDILGPLPITENGNSYVLVASDYFTRWVEAYPIPNQEAVTVARILTQEMFFRFSVPEQLHSDQGRQFESQLIAEICKLLKISKTRTTPYHPQGDGLVERFNRTLLNMLATTVKSHQGDWEDHIRAVCLAYNSSVQHTTGYTPFYLMFGRQARIPVDLMFKSNLPEEMPHSDYAVLLKSTLEEAYGQVREKMELKQEAQKQSYDRKVHGKPYNVGDMVWLHSTVVPRGTAKKLHHPWTGPYRVVKCLSDITYRIENVKSKRQRQVVHFDRLKPYASPNQPSNSQSASTTDHPVQPGVTQPNTRRLFGDQLTLVDPEDTDSQSASQQPVNARLSLRRSTRTRTPVVRFEPSTT